MALVNVLSTLYQRGLCRELLRSDSADPALSISRVVSQMEAWKAYQVSTDVRWVHLSGW